MAKSALMRLGLVYKSITHHRARPNGAFELMIMSRD